MLNTTRGTAVFAISEFVLNILIKSYLVLGEFVLSVFVQSEIVQSEFVLSVYVNCAFVQSDFVLSVREKLKNESMMWLYFPWSVRVSSIIVSWN